MVYGGVWWYMVVLVVYGVVWWYMVLVVLPSAVDLGRFIHRYLAPGRRALAGCYSRRPTSWPASTVRNAGEGSQVKIQSENTNTNTNTKNSTGQIHLYKWNTSEMKNKQ